MALDADTLLDRIQLKQQVTRWRTIAFAIAAAVLVWWASTLPTAKSVSGPHIARITVADVIVDDVRRDELLENIRTNNSIKAVFVRIDSPGGTAVGGEELYLALRRISEQKPVVILMRTLCTSAGYMAALGGDYILARESTITGSVGVLMQSFEATGLAKKIGIEPVIVKSAEHKATPNPLEPFTPSQRAVIENVVQDFYRYFADLVQERRDLTDEQMITIGDGRIFTGSQALKAGLIDALGGEIEAHEWLKKEREFKTELPVKDMKPRREVRSFLSKFEEMSNHPIFSWKEMMVKLDGLALIWQPAAQH